MQSKSSNVFIVPAIYDEVVIDGVRFSREVLEMMTRPDPEALVSFRRVGDEVRGTRERMVSA